MSLTFLLTTTIRSTLKQVVALRIERSEFQAHKDASGLEKSQSRGSSLLSSHAQVRSDTMRFAQAKDLFG